MFDWLNKIFEGLFRFIPNFRIVPPHSEAVRVTCIPFMKGQTSIKKFGWYLYWPLFQQWYELVVKPQIITIDLARHNQSGQSIESVWAIQYWIQNIEKALFEVEDHEERLASLASKVVGEFIETQDPPWTPQVCDEIVKRVRTEIIGMGLYVQQVFPLQYVKARAYKLFLENLVERTGRIIG